MNSFIASIVGSLICSTVLRLILSCLSLHEYNHFSQTKEHPLIKEPVFESFQKNKWWRKWWIKFWGYYTYQDPEPDLWLNFLIGAIELVAYPHLMMAGRWEIIGVWIGFKVFVPGIKYTSSKLSVNRFVLINAINILIALIFAWQNLYDCSIVRFLKH